MKIVELADLYVSLNVFSPATEKHIRLIMRLFAERSGVEELESVNVMALQRFKTRTLQVSRPVTYNGYVKYLRRFGDFAVEMKWLQENIFRHLKMAPIGKLPKKALKPGEPEAIVGFIERHPDSFRPTWFWSALTWTLFYTGMRRRQIAMLKVNDLDFVNETVRLRYENSKTKREWVVPMHPALKSTLRDYLRRVELASRRLRGNDALFSIARLNPNYAHCSRHEPIRPEQISGFFKRCSKLGGIQVSAHRFRHTLATTLCNPSSGNPDLFAVQEILGHVNLSTTRIYVETPVSRMEHVIRQLPDKPVGRT